MIYGERTEQTEGEIMGKLEHENEICGSAFYLWNLQENTPISKLVKRKKHESSFPELLK
jgi:hypothetical protein